MVGEAFPEAVRLVMLWRIFFPKSTQVQIIICTCVLFGKNYFIFSYKLIIFKLPPFQLQIKTPPQCWGLDHRDPRERETVFPKVPREGELILWISLERDDYLGSSTSSPLVGEGGRRDSNSLLLATGGRRDSSSLVLATGGRRRREGGTNLPS